jgi:hypothetical protein
MKRALFVLLLLGGCHGTLPPLDGELAAGDGGEAMDMGPNPDALGQFGDNCSLDSDCATGHCFLGNARHFCTMPCTPATQMADCPSPPTSGMCNMRGFCKP